jgi:hypothetical protein
METVLNLKNTKKPVTTTILKILFDEWVKGAGKDAEAKREKVAKELVDAHELNHSGTIHSARSRSARCN